MDKRDQERALAKLTRALDDLAVAQRQADEALVAAIELRCGTTARKLMDVTEPTFWRRVRAARERLG